MQILVKEIAAHAEIDETKALQALLIICDHIKQQSPMLGAFADSLIGMRTNSFINETYVKVNPAKTV